MIGQITPLVQEAGKRTWAKATIAYTVGATLSAGMLGFALGLIGLAVGASRWGSLTVAGGVIAACALVEAGLLPVRVPSLRRQTPRWLPDVYGPVWGSLAWGIDLGQGWTTRIESSGYYAVLLLALLIADPARSGLGMVCFGLGRGLPLFVTGAMAIRFAGGALRFPHEASTYATRCISVGVLGAAAALLLVP